MSFRRSAVVSYSSRSGDGLMRTTRAAGGGGGAAVVVAGAADDVVAATGVGGVHLESSISMRLRRVETRVPQPISRIARRRCSWPPPPLPLARSFDATRRSHADRAAVAARASGHSR